MNRAVIVFVKRLAFDSRILFACWFGDFGGFRLVKFGIVSDEDS